MDKFFSRHGGSRRKTGRNWQPAVARFPAAPDRSGRVAEFVLGAQEESGLGIFWVGERRVGGEGAVGELTGAPDQVGLRDQISEA